MRPSWLCSAIALGCFAALLPEALAQDALSGINDAGAQLANNANPEFGDIAITIADKFIPLINIVAIIMVAISGITLALSQGQEQIGIARNTFLGSLTAIFIVWIARAVTNAVVGGGGLIQNPSGASSGLREEIVGIIEWMQVPAATICVLMIIISGIRAILSWGSDEGIRHLRRTVFAVIIGFTLIAIKFFIEDSLTISGTPDGIIGAIVLSINGLLGFLALIAVVVIVIAGIMMVVNLGNDDQYKRARDLIIRVAIGLLVVIASWAIVNIIVAGVF